MPGQQEAGTNDVVPASSMPVPHSYADTMSSSRAKECHAAIQKEPPSLQHDVADLVSPKSVPTYCGITGTKWTDEARSSSGYSDSSFNQQQQDQGRYFVVEKC